MIAFRIHFSTNDIADRLGSVDQRICDIATEGGHHGAPLETINGGGRIDRGDAASEGRNHAEDVTLDDNATDICLCIDIADQIVAGIHTS